MGWGWKCVHVSRTKAIGANNLWEESLDQLLRIPSHVCSDVRLIILLWFLWFAYSFPLVDYGFLKATHWLLCACLHHETTFHSVPAGSYAVFT